MDKYRREFLASKVPELMNRLSSEMKGDFGIMTPQHMVEHLIITTKSTAKKYEGIRENPTNKRQLGFQKFIGNGCKFEHRPSDKTIEDLPPLKYNSLQAAIAIIPEAVNRFYSLWEQEPDYIPYNPFMGSLTFEELELFHYHHFKYHLWQFGVIAQFS